MTSDLLLTGGTVIDGTGGPARPADVLVDQGVITGIIDHGGGEPPGPDAREVVDCTRLVIAPGFIDIHTHSDLTVLANPGADSAVLQGITTQVVGNCGFSPHPGGAGSRRSLVEHFAGVGGERVPIDWRDIDGYADAFRQRRPALNVVALIGHGALRIAAMADPDAPATDDDIAAMRRLLRENLEQGAAGLSTGLTYPPSALADTGEIKELAAECAAVDRVYATHSRAFAANELSAIDEAIEVSRATRARLQYSHVALNNPENWGRAADVLEKFDEAVAAGLDVGFDVYPYHASSSSALQYLPLWVQHGGDDALSRNARETGWRARALQEIQAGFFGGIRWRWDRIVLSAVPGRADLAGKTFTQLAEYLDLPPEEVLLDLCAQHGSAVQVVLHYRTERDMCAFLASPHAVVGSDGQARPRNLADDHPHPRSFGTFPRVLGRYVRDRALMDLPTAIGKMTGRPASRLGLADRGVVREGYVADLVVFDPDVICDRASFAEPTLPPVGIVRTIVGGETVVKGGTVTDRRPGRLVRCGT